MAKKEEAAALLWLGLSPKEIAGIQEVPLEVLLGYLDTMIGRGIIRRSDVYFSMPRAVRTAVRQQDHEQGEQQESLGTLTDRLAKAGYDIDGDDVTIIRAYGSLRHALGDFYEDIRAIEVGLHRLVRESLQAEFGEADDDWFRSGVPRSVREKCGARWAGEDISPVPHPYCFTDLLDLRHILDKRWTAIAPRLPGKLASDKKPLLSDLMRLNEIRRVVMHPSRGGVPSEDDFDFLWNLQKRFGFEDSSAVITVSLDQMKAKLEALPEPLLGKVRERLNQRF